MIGTTRPESTADLVHWATGRLTGCGVESPRLEAQLLVALAFGSTRSAVIAGIPRPACEADLNRFRKLVEARCEGTPFAYLRGFQEFYGLDFEVNPAVLIPRPETEMLVDFAVERLSASESERNGGLDRPGPVFADVGTGSGCIAIAALSIRPEARALAFDISPNALGVARRNAARHRVDPRLRFVRGDLLGGVANGAFELIVSNPPYIAVGDLPALQREVRDAEPPIALVGGSDGLDVYRRLVPSAARCLVPGGWLALEVGMGQAPSVAHILDAAGFNDIDLRRDLAGIERLVAGRTGTNRF